MIQCPPKDKADFVCRFVQKIPKTQYIIFVESRYFAEKLHNLLNKTNFKSVLIFGKVDPKERDEMMTRFRKECVVILITTNALLKDIDVP